MAPDSVENRPTRGSFSREVLMAGRKSLFVARQSRGIGGVALLAGLLHLLGSTRIAAVESIFLDGFESGDTAAWSSATMPPCPRSCGTTELCDVAHRGYDDDCDGLVDEGCACVPGTAQSCFAGDPSYFGTPNCFPGRQSCQEDGSWGACTGGVDALALCFLVDSTSCHAVAAHAFVPLDLHQGLGNFGADAITESWDVTCPDALVTCPVSPGAVFSPVIDGEHSVLYTKTTPSGGDQCTFPLFAGGAGALRVELQWENDSGSGGVDLDLHLHRPGDTAAWGGAQGNAVDCAWDNCMASDAGSGTLPSWFSGGAPPAPISWWLDPVPENNSCLYAPKGEGGAWSATGLGCHNPRLDVDQSDCDPLVTDRASTTFCAGEVASIDFMPSQTWTRVAVHYFSAAGQSYGVHPEVRIYCDGQLAADLGPAGFGTPQAPVTFPAADGGTLYWLVADVAFGRDAYGTRRCLVEPLYQDAGSRTPLLTTAAAAAASFGPAYPLPPDFGSPNCPE